MDGIQHHYHKIATERVSQHSMQPIVSAPPPPYTPSETSSEDDDSDTEDVSSPLRLTINAANRIEGHNNLVPLSPTAISDATRFSTMLLAAINQINSAANGTRNVKVDLTINCGVTVIGSRNVIGNVGLKPKQAPQALSRAAESSAVAVGTVAGAKRKAGEDDDAGEGPDAKRFAVGNVDD